MSSLQESFLLVKRALNEPVSKFYIYFCPTITTLSLTLSKLANWTNYVHDVLLMNWINSYVIKNVYI